MMDFKMGKILIDFKMCGSKQIEMIEYYQQTVLSLSVMEYFSLVSRPLICDRMVLSSDSFLFCFICSFSSSDNFSFLALSWFNIFSSHRRAFIFRSLAPPDITPDF